MKVARLAIALVSISVVASLAMAQDNGGPRRGQRGQGFGGMDVSAMFDRLVSNVQKLDLTADQKDKLEALKKEYAPKVKAIREKADSVLTDDQKALVKAAREASGREARREAFQKMREGMKLTDDQKKQMEPIAKEGRSLFESVRDKVRGMLTDEQKTKLQEMTGRRGGRRQGGGNADKSQST